MSDHRPADKQKQGGMEVYWTTVTYRSVILMVLLALGLILGGWYLLHPSSFNAVLKKLTEGSGDDSKAAPLVNQARFVNLDGKVQVRKPGSAGWVTVSGGLSAPDYQIALDKGDLIQTGSDGVARIAFANGSTYTVKADTLITVESNAVGSAAETRVAVHVQSGAVDLNTAGSKAEVSFEDAVAQLNQNSRANVRTDPAAGRHEINVSTGTAELKRGGESIQLGPYERAKFPTGGAITKSQVLAPPELTSPLNLTPIMVAEPKQHAVRFEWRPVPGAVEYNLRVSTTSMFTQVVADKKVSGPSTTVSGLAAGDYFWAVSATDAQRGASEPSDVYKFTLAASGRAQSMLLEIENVQLHGNVVEIRGRTEPGAALLINGLAVPSSSIGNDGKFRYFTPQLPRGPATVRIAGQNRRGGTAEISQNIMIP